VLQKKRNPIHANFFVEGLRPLNPELAQKLDAGVKTHPKSLSLVAAIQRSFTQHIGFWTVSFLVSFFSLIPVVGWVLTLILQTYLNCFYLASRVLRVYMKQISSMNKAQQEQWRQDNRAVLLGFSAPYVLLSSIPIIGAFALVYAEASAADLVHYEFMKGSASISSIPSTSQKERRQIDLKSPQQRDDLTRGTY